MPRQVLDPLRLAVALDITAAGIDRPDRVRDLAADQFIIGVAGAERDIRLALRQIEIAVSADELDAKLRMLGVEAVDERGHPINDRLRTGHPNDACGIMRGIANMPLQFLDRSLDMLRVR